MNKTLKTGLFMQLIQAIGLVLFGVGYYLSGIEWTADLMITIALSSIVAIFNIFSIIMIIGGALKKEEKPCRPDEDYY